MQKCTEGLSLLSSRGQPGLVNSSLLPWEEGKTVHNQDLEEQTALLRADNSINSHRVK